MNALLYTSEEQAIFNKAVQYGQAYFDTLTDYQKALLQAFAQNQLEGAQRTALILLQKNPDHDYPIGCEGVKRGQYWLDHVTAYKPAIAVLGLFEVPKIIISTTVTAQPKKDNKLATRKHPATLQQPLTVEAVKAKFGELQITKEGETAAALTALVVSGCLVGDPTKVHRWIEAAKIGPVPSPRTVANKMENSQGVQFKNPIERKVFNDVLIWAKTIR